MKAVNTVLLVLVQSRVVTSTFILYLSKSNPRKTTQVKVKVLLVKRP